MLIVQVNGKMRDRIEVSAKISEADAEALARSSEKLTDWISGGVKKVIARPPNIVNFVV